MVRMKLPFGWVVKIMIFAILLYGLIGCETLKKLNQLGGSDKSKYVPSTAESFVVLPFNNYIHQLEFAAKVESVMAQAGLNLVAAPRGIKEVEERKGAGIAQDSGAKGMADTTIQREESQSTRIEKYMMATEETKADYLVETMLTGYNGTIKFTRKIDRKVISVFTVSDTPSMLEDELIMQLEKMKFLSQGKEDSPKQ